MIVRHNFPHKHRNFLLTGMLSLVLGFPTVGLAIGYGDSHHPSGHGLSPHGMSPHGMSPHGTGTYGHNDMHHGMNVHGGHGKSYGYDKAGSGHQSGHGSHQSASQFIKHILKYKDGMGITDDQSAKLHKIKTDFEKSKIQMKADIEMANLDLHEQLRNEKEDLSAVESQLKKIFEMKANLLLASVKAQREAKDVLTEEQRSRMKAVHERMNAYKEGGMMKGHPGGYSHSSKDKEKKDKED